MNFPVGRWLATGLLLGVACGSATVAARLWPECAFDRRELAWRENCVFTDRHGVPLRVFPDEAGERHAWVPIGRIPRTVRSAFLAAEDRRFERHRGVDPLALLRAAADNLRGGRIVSGASTITMQSWRLLRPHARSYEGKLREVIGALRMEEALTKDEILEQYLNRVPLGNNLRGVGIAAKTWFGKEPARLTPAEAALLAALPKAPGLLSPYGPNRERLEARRKAVLEAMAAGGELDPAALRQALAEKVTVRPYAFPMKAPHLVELLAARGHRSPGVHRTTLDLALQADVERIVASQAARLAARKVRQAAVLVVKNDTMEVLAYVGSAGPAAGTADCCNDGVQALRSAGSTLKPFLYARAIEAGYPASTLLSDTLRRYRSPAGDYTPDNFDRNEYGPVTMRVALANSLNVSAVRMLDMLGLDAFYRALSDARLVDGGAAGSTDPAGRYGLGMAIGNVEVTLERLAAAYAMLANGGGYRPLRYLAVERPGKVAPARRVFFPETACVITDILADPSARLVAFGAGFGQDTPFPVSVKTGTSTGYRDGWTVGYTPEYTVAVWTGNFDGSPTAGLSGSWGASPIFFKVMAALHADSPPSPFRRPEGVVSAEVCGLSGMKPGPGCRHVTRELFLKDSAPGTPCSFHAGGEEYHALPTPFAPWLAARQRRGAEGGFRLAGSASAFPDPDAGLPPPASPGIRVRGAAPPAAPPPDAPPLRGHLSLGAGATAEAASPAEERQRIRIVHPMPHDRFVVDRRDPLQFIRLDTELDEPGDYVDWFIDGKHFARAGPPYSVFWPPERGRHRITAATPGRLADHVTISVE